MNGRVLMTNFYFNHDPANLPDFSEGSAIGEPDIVIQMEEPYFISGNYEDDYRCIILSTEFDEAVDLSAM